MVIIYLFEQSMDRLVKDLKSVFLILSNKETENEINNKCLFCFIDYMQIVGSEFSDFVVALFNNVGIKVNNEIEIFQTSELHQSYNLAQRKAHIKKIKSDLYGNFLFKMVDKVYHLLLDVRSLSNQDLLDLNCAFFHTYSYVIWNNDIVLKLNMICTKMHKEDVFYVGSSKLGKSLHMNGSKKVSFNDIIEVFTKASSNGRTFNLENVKNTWTEILQDKNLPSQTMESQFQYIIQLYTACPFKSKFQSPNDSKFQLPNEISYDNVKKSRVLHLLRQCIQGREGAFIPHIKNYKSSSEVISESCSIISKKSCIADRLKTKAISYLLNQKLDSDGVKRLIQNFIQKLGNNNCINSKSPSSRALITDTTLSSNAVTEKLQPHQHECRDYFLKSFEDPISSSHGFRSFQVSEENQNNVNYSFLSGILTFLIHAIRLILVSNPSANVSHSKLISLFKSLIAQGENVWYAEYFLNNNNMEETRISNFVSFIPTLAQRFETNELLFLGTLSWDSFSEETLNEAVINHFNNNLMESKNSSLFFLSFSGGLPSVNYFPYVFRGKDIYNVINKVLHVSNEDPKRLCLQTFGLIYTSESENPINRFMFITHSRCYEMEYCQYLLLEHNPSSGDIDKKCNIQYNPKVEATKIQTSLRDEHSNYVLTGVVLIQNDEQEAATSNYHLISPTVHAVLDKYKITCISLRTLGEPKGWLDDNIIEAAMNLCNNFFGFGAGNTTSVVKEIRFSQFTEHMQTNKTSGCLININDQYEHIKINCNDQHWLYSCISSVTHTIYIMDSFNDFQNCANYGQKILEYIKFLNKHAAYEYKMVQSAPQNDNNSCGLFAILNCLRCIKAISEGSFNSLVSDNTCMGSWANKSFSVDEKQQLRKDLMHVLLNKNEVTVLLKYIN